jgi:hypothetical protein
LPTERPQQVLLLPPAPEPQALQAPTQWLRPELQLAPMVQELAQPARMQRRALQQVL